MRGFFICFLVLTFGAAAAGVFAQAEIHGTWTAELNIGRVFLQVRTDAPDSQSADRRGGWNMGETFSVEELAGLPANDDRLTASNVKFDMRREAGTLGFEGSFRDGRGAGLFTFTPRAAYTAEIKSLGFNDDLDLWRRYQLAVHDIGPRYIRDLRSERFDKLTLDQIERAKTHGVTIEYIKGIKAQGYTAATLDEFVRTRDHGVTQAYIQGMRQAGFGNVTVDELVRARDNGVTPEFVKEMKDSGSQSPASTRTSVCATTVSRPRTRQSSKLRATTSSRPTS